ncbi:MAG: DUF448 domain-containing protein [Desulfuromonadales bacterium]|nr:DUF448 domain-containing protein [Desulfuromonadales bacterium]
MAKQHEQEKPQRSCLGCRETRDKERLIRFVLSPQGEVVPDLEAKLPGRGAYTCISSRCLDVAIKQRLFNRAFKCDVSVLPSNDMLALVGLLMREKILGYLGLANKAGKIISGSSLVCDAIRGNNKPGLVLVAVDVSGSIGEKIISLAALHQVRTEKVMTKEEFGAILGKSLRSAVAVRQGGFIVRLVSVIERYRNFLGEV